MYTAKTRSSNKRKTVLIAALAACLILAVGGGVLAWFSASDIKTNTFAQGGGVNEPDKKPDPDDPTKPGTEIPGENDHFIIETEWTDNSAISPDSIVPKNPNVGIGPSSNPAYVFVEVENNLPNSAYFILGSGWAPVDGYTGNVAFNETGAPARAYKSGLFVYIGTTNDMALLGPTAVNVNAFTGEVFDKIYTTHDFKWDSTGAKTSISVKSFLAVANSATEYDGIDQAGKNEIVEKAKSWADNNSDLKPGGTTKA